LPGTHKDFIEEIESMEEEKIIIFPMFPQFSYATTGSIARWFEKELSQKTLSKLFWIKSYFSHPLFIKCQKELISNFLMSHKLRPEDTLLFFSMHGLPQCFVCLGDPYEEECRKSYEALAAEFSEYQTTFAFQSKFGPGLWLKPYTDETCYQVNAKNVVFIPLSFTSDHIETLFEIEQQYLPIIRKKGFNAYRCPVLNHQKSWIDAIAKMLEEKQLFQNESLVRRITKRRLCEEKCKKRTEACNQQVKCRRDDPACSLKEP
jgi:ferrochelatase